MNKKTLSSPLPLVLRCWPPHRRGPTIPATRGTDEVGQWFIAPFIGYTWVDSSRLLDDGMYWGGALGKHLNDDWSAQIAGYTGS